MEMMDCDDVKQLFFCAAADNLRMEQVIRRRCDGCNGTEFEPNQMAHDVCVLMSPEERLDLYLDEMLETTAREDILHSFKLLVMDSKVSVGGIDYVLNSVIDFITKHDPVSKLRSDSAWKEEFKRSYLIK